MIETATFICSICGETSTDICVYCTKDTCSNHRCLRCLRCSDCCECEVPLTAAEPEPAAPPPYAEFVPEPWAEDLPVVTTEPSVVSEQGQAPVIPEQVAVEPLEVHIEVVEFETLEAEAEAPEPETVDELQLEPETTAAASIHQATTTEELVRALPELFAPEPSRPATPPQLPTDEPAGEHEPPNEEAKSEHEEKPAGEHEPPDEPKS